MKSTAKSNRKRDRRETETKADFCSGHEWVGWGRDTRQQRIRVKRNMQSRTPLYHVSGEMKCQAVKTLISAGQISRG